MDFFSAIISGVLIFALQQIILKIFIEPVQSFKKEIEETLNDCVYYADVINGTGREELANKAFDTFRKHSGNLKSKKSIIPCFDFLASFGLFPNSESMTKVFDDLMFISNNSKPEGKENTAIRTDIEKYLQHRVNKFEVICSMIIFLFLMAGTVQIIKWLVQFIELL